MKKEELLDVITNYKNKSNKQLELALQDQSIISSINQIIKNYKPDNNSKKS